MALISTQRKIFAGVLVIGVALGLTPAFTSFAPGRSEGSWSTHRLAAQTSSAHVGVVSQHSTSRTTPVLGEVGVGTFATATFVAMAAILGVHKGRRTTLGGLGRDHALVPVCNQVAPPVLAGNSLSIAPPVLKVRNKCVPSSLVARKWGMSNCNALWFKRTNPPYLRNFKRNIRNRSYNLSLKIKFKMQIQLVSRYVKKVIFDETTVSSVEEMVQNIKPDLDLAHQYIDFTTTQGVLERSAAARFKEKMCKMLMWAAHEKGLIEQPDPYLPAYKNIGYEPPVYNFMREPRPWQLPAWKNPYMMKTEYDQWKELKPVWKEKKAEQRRLAEEAAAAAAAAAAEAPADGEDAA